MVLKDELDVESSNNISFLNIFIYLFHIYIYIFHNQNRGYMFHHDSKLEERITNNKSISSTNNLAKSCIS